MHYQTMHVCSYQGLALPTVCELLCDELAPSLWHGSLLLTVTDTTLISVEILLSFDGENTHRGAPFPCGKLYKVWSDIDRREGRHEGRHEGRREGRGEGRHEGRREGRGVQQRILTSFL